MLKVEHEMRRQGITQTELAERTGVNRVSINRIIRGKEQAWPKYRNAIAQALGWNGNTSELFEEAAGE